MKRKKVHVYITIVGIWTEKQLKKVMDAADVPKKSITVIRNAAGQAIKLVIYTYDSKLADLQEDLAELHFPATIVTSDIVPGTTGFDGTADGLASLLSQGYTQSFYNGGPVFTYNTDGTLTMSPNGDICRVDYVNTSGTAIKTGVPFVFETRCLITGVNQTSVGITQSNGTYAADNDITTYQNLGQIVGDNLGGSVSPSMPLLPDSQFHTYRFEQSLTGLVTMYKDGTQVGTLQLQAGSSSNYMYLTFIVSSDGSITLDYARWTTPA